MLEVFHLTKRFHRKPAVDDVSFSIRPGDVLGYVGPNGSGKSTTVKMLTGLLDPTSGQVFYRGRNVRDDLTGFKQVLGYVPEEPFVYPYLTGREYLQLTGRLRSIPEKALCAKIDALLDLFSLYEHRYSPIAAYSKGMKQKILIGAALLHDPEVVIFDEPLSGLDVTTAMIFKNLVRELSGKGKIILYSSHVLEVVEKVCTRVLILRCGQVVAHDSVENLRTLLSSPSLESVFAQLVVREDTGKIARNMMGLIAG
ncbi:MAG: ABC transporter ATP-binding protein [Bryobacterales bacterium]|nr:ABC transporter ATP-binding protein [Bryobacterales bacterium]